MQPLKRRRSARKPCPVRRFNAPVPSSDYESNDDEHLDLEYSNHQAGDHARNDTNALTSTTRDASQRVLHWNLKLRSTNCPERREEAIILRVKHFYQCPMDEDCTVPSVSPTAQELDTTRDGPFAVWVGMRPRDAERYGSKRASAETRPKQQHGNGRRVNNLKLRRPVDHMSALRVVVELYRRKMEFYVLVNRDDTGLCEARKIDIDEVFFAPRFYTPSLPKWEQRRSNCRALIKAHIIAYLENNASRIAKTFDEDDIEPPEPPEPKKGIIVDDEAEDVDLIQEPSQDPHLASQRNNEADRFPAIATMLDIHAKWTQYEAGAAHYEIVRRFPDLRQGSCNLQAEAVMHFGVAVRGTGLKIEIPPLRVCLKRFSKKYQKAFTRARDKNLFRTPDHPEVSEIGRAILFKTYDQARDYIRPESS